MLLRQDLWTVSYFRLSAPSSSRASWMTARLWTPVITSPPASFTETSKAYSLPSRPVYRAVAETRAPVGVAAVCFTSTMTPTDSSPSERSGASTRPAASSQSAMARVVANTAGYVSPVMWFRALARSCSATTISTCPVAPTSGSRVGMSLLREKQLELADAAGDVIAGLLPVGLGEQLSGGTLRHRDQRLQLDLERIAGGDEVGEGLLQVLLAHLLAAVGHGPELGAHQRGLQIGSAHFRQVGRQHLAQIAVELHPRLLRHRAHQLEPFLVRLRVEQSEEILREKLALKIKRQEIGEAGQEEPDDLSAVAGVAHERGDLAEPARAGARVPLRAAVAQERVGLVDDHRHRPHRLEQVEDLLEVSLGHALPLRAEVEELHAGDADLAREAGGEEGLAGPDRPRDQEAHRHHVALARLDCLRRLAQQLLRLPVAGHHVDGVLRLDELEQAVDLRLDDLLLLLLQP